MTLCPYTTCVQYERRTRLSEHLAGTLAVSNHRYRRSLITNVGGRSRIYRGAANALRRRSQGQPADFLVLARLAAPDHGLDRPGLVAADRGRCLGALAGAFGQRELRRLRMDGAALLRLGCADDLPRDRAVDLRL